jgi:AcrR family transcriptional regulator
MNRAATTDTRQVIIDAAHACFRQHGMRKTTIADIGRAAGLSRGTIYQYFRDKAAIVEACTESVTERFEQEMAKAMSAGTTLEDKLSRAAMFASQARRFIGPDEYFDEDELSLLLAKDAELLQEGVEFFTPYLAAAQQTGEVRENLDVQAAAEWFARILFSLVSTPSLTLDMDDPDIVRTFVRDHVVRGFR